jgi:hypothetical protein
MEIHHLHVRNGVILEDSSEEILVTLTPLSESHAFVVGASSLVPLVPVSQAPALGGDDPDDSSDEEDDDEEEEEENNDDEDANNEQEQEDNFVGLWPIAEHYTSMFETGHCRRFEPGGSLDRRVNCRRVPQPRWVGARRSAKGGGSQRETGVRGGISRPSCLSRAQVGCACSRGLQASTREGASGLTRAPSRPSPRGQPSVRRP